MMHAILGALAAASSGSKALIGGIHGVGSPITAEALC